MLSAQLVIPVVLVEDLEGKIMARFDVSARTTLVTATAYAALAALRGSTTKPTLVWEIHCFGITAPASPGGIGLCISTALGTGGLTSVTPVGRRQPNTPGAVLVTNWATLAPTNGGAGTIFKRWIQSAAVGNGIIWTFDGEPFEMGLGGAAAGELCIVNLFATAPGTFEISMVVEE